MRQIDWDQPLSEDDEVWLNQRLTPELKEKIAANKARFGGEDAEVETETSEFKDDYDSWKLAELKEEADNRGDLDTTGFSKKADYIAALRTWDAEHPDDE